MHSNRKLTNLLKGRALASAQNQDGALMIGFDDGSTMKVKTAAASAEGNTPSGGKVAKVRQEDTTLALDFEDGATWELKTAEASSSVMVRDKAGAMEYAD